MGYNIYANDGLSGPIDYSTPIGTTTGLSFVVGPIDPPGDYRFGVRAFDSTTLLEEANTDASVRVLTDQAGNDITARPNPPGFLTARLIAGGGCRLTWVYSTAAQGGAPAGFQVYLTPGASPDYGSPAATVPYVAGSIGYSCDLGGLAAGSTYTVAVRSYNGTATEDNTTAQATFRTNPETSDPVDSLTAVAT